MNAFNNTGYLNWLKAHYKALLIVQVIAVVASVIFSSPYFMPMQFKSFAIVYPYNLSTYSHETPTEQMLEFLDSRDIKEGVINKCNLVAHYKTDTAESDWKSILLDKFDKNVIISSTEYEAVEITAYDVNPEMAYKIVKSVLAVLNQKVLNVQKAKSMEVARMWKKQVDMKKKECDSLADRSKLLSTQYGLLEYGSQTREVTKAYYQNSSPSKNVEIAQQMKNMEEKSTELQATSQHLSAALANYDDLLIKYEDAEKDVNKQLTFSNVITSPFTADKKTYPIRWLIVLITCISAFIFSAVVIRFTEKIKQ